MYQAAILLYIIYQLQKGSAQLSSTALMDDGQFIFPTFFFGINLNLNMSNQSKAIMFQEFENKFAIYKGK